MGDELRDQEAARAAGVDFAAVSWGYTVREALDAAGPALLFDTVEEMVAQLIGRAAD